MFYHLHIALHTLELLQVAVQSLDVLQKSWLLVRSTYRGDQLLRQERKLVSQ